MLSANEKSLDLQDKFLKIVFFKNYFTGITCCDKNNLSLDLEVSSMCCNLFFFFFFEVKLGNLILCY
jgi:hypothetical protein